MLSQVKTRDVVKTCPCSILSMGPWNLCGFDPVTSVTRVIDSHLTTVLAWSTGPSEDAERVRDEQSQVRIATAEVRITLHPGPPAARDSYINCFHAPVNDYMFSLRTSSTTVL